jgi:hypothetical protein
MKYAAQRGNDEISHNILSASYFLNLIHFFKHGLVFSYTKKKKNEEKN